MAITYADFFFLNALKRDGKFPDKPTVLEFGQSNWYGDVEIEVLKAAMKDSPDLLPELDQDSFRQARAYYRWLLDYSWIKAIDLHGPPSACKFDLNHFNPCVHQGGWADTFEVLLNLGTAEHVFDQRRFYQTVHECCRKDGVMVHSSPLWGWTNHGFFNQSPTLYADLAAENGYEILQWWWADLTPKTANVVEVKRMEDFDALATQLGIGTCSMQLVALRKVHNVPFRVPRQGVYSDRNNPELLENWKNCRGKAE